MIPDRVMRKIQRCLALSKSDNGNEAGIALRQAQVLMAEHGVSQEALAIADFDVASVDTRAGRTPPRYLESLAQLVNAAFGTTTVYSWRGVKGVIEFLGPRDAVLIAGYSFEVLQRQLIRDRRNFLCTQSPRLKRMTKIRRGDAFAEAWVVGVRKLVRPMAMTDEMKTLHRTYRERRFGALDMLTTRERQPLRRHDHVAVEAGYEAGSSAQLSAGVTRTQREGLTHG
ncbi:DUF2786 domain-containing protein [Billgrantia montanilacus]|uniref:DUF2786 domain-containing protein n=1 Tax=Billgrantia montanilacus TaxID=2282305 RepID=A0A368TQL1_9GAMM|nr:DUF2786 domain-containing protein [Halomonas montanilacus]RCV86890.1 DUF2786 domain-containing protein [Halomonas montanilacus]